MSESGYNGYSNYETWNVSLWLGNDESLYEWFDSMLKEEIETNYDDWQSSATKILQAFIEENNPLSGQCSMYSDIMTASLNSVDYREIVESSGDEHEKQYLEDNQKEFIAFIEECLAVNDNPFDGLLCATEDYPALSQDRAETDINELLDELGVSITIQCDQTFLNLVDKEKAKEYWPNWESVCRKSD